MASRTARRRILRVAVPGAGGGTGGDAGVRTQRADLLATEEPLEIRVDCVPLAVTMRTPGDDIDLASGFLATEGLIRSADDVTEIRICHETHEDHRPARMLVAAGLSGPDAAAAAGGLADEAERHHGNVADVTLAPGIAVDPDRLRRNFLTTSACGVCGKTSIDAIRVRASYDLTTDQQQVTPAVLAELPGRLRDAQRVFDRTGGLHAAGVFRADGTLLAMREDVGRHNAVDKVAGWALREGHLPLAGCVLLVSGRASFELVQKAVIAGIPVVAAVSAPSSLAAELADETGLTLVGFLRGGTMNVYTWPERIAG